MHTMGTPVELLSKRKYTKLSSGAWAEVEGLWQSGEATLAELSETFGPSARALQNRFAKVGITKGEKAAALATAVRQEVELASPDQLVERAKDIRERSYLNALTVENLVMAQLQLAEHDPSLVLRAGAAIKMLSLAAASLERLHTLKKSALGLDRDSGIADELPQIVIRDLTDEEMTSMRESAKAEDEPDDLPSEIEENGDQDRSSEDDDIVIYHEKPRGSVERVDQPVRQCDDGSRLVR